jgi:hypothetical protein
MNRKKVALKECSICRLKSKHVTEPVQISPYIAGPSRIIDLDGRPKELTESLLKKKLEICPHCGYISEDIEEKSSASKDFITFIQGNDPTPPDMLLSPFLYLRAAEIKERDNKTETAIEYYIAAAWCADSILLPDIARLSRKKALSLIFPGNKTFADIPATQWIPVLDTMRRCGDFGEVITYCTNLMPIAGLNLQRELEYELVCAKYGDSAIHTTADLAIHQHSLSEPHKIHEELIIAGKTYFCEDDCYGKGWKWTAETRTLLLSNYHGTAITATGNITIQIEQIDNQIISSHSPGIRIKNGNLVIKGLGALLIKGEEIGIDVDSGTLEVIQRSVLEILTTGDGIRASGTIFISEGSVLDICSEKTAIRSLKGGLTSTLGPVVMIKGQEGGMELAGESTFSAGLYRIESSEGTGIHINHGSLSISDCMIDIVSHEKSIWIGDGDFKQHMARTILNGSTGIQVTGSCLIEKSRVNVSGEEYAFFVSKNMNCQDARLECSGKTLISTGGELNLSSSGITGSGEIGISTGGNLIASRGNLVFTGDTVMQIAGNCDLSDSLIMGIGRIAGIRVDGSYSQSRGDVSISGEARNGMIVSGREMILNGVLSASGRNCGLEVSGDIILDDFALSVSGNIGLSAGGSLKVDNGDLMIRGEEIGLSMKEGNLELGVTVTSVITGNTGIYSANDIEIAGGSLQNHGIRQPHNYPGGHRDISRR